MIILKFVLKLHIARIFYCLRSATVKTVIKFNYNLLVRLYQGSNLLEKVARSMFKVDELP